MEEGEQAREGALRSRQEWAEGELVTGAVK